MYNFLPASGLKGIGPKELNKLKNNLNKYTSNSIKGCLLKVDFQYT